MWRQGDEQPQNFDHWNRVDCDPVRVGDCGVGWMEARIRAEERLLREHFGTEYEAYCAQTWRLLPGIY
jgi:hypothetical protein